MHTEESSLKRLLHFFCEMGNVINITDRFTQLVLSKRLLSDHCLMEWKVLSEKGQNYKGMYFTL